MSPADKLPEPIYSPLKGVCEHYDGATWFHGLSLVASASPVKFRLGIAAIYFARGAVELMLETALDQELKAYKNDDPNVSRESFEGELKRRFSLYNLVERIRIHDFHRMACLSPESKIRKMMYSDPKK
jgi:hypothetical protein